LQIFDAEEASLVSTIADNNRLPSLAGFVVRLRGLPFSSAAEDVLNFFHPIIPVGESSGVLFSCAQDGRFTGEAFIELETKEDFEVSLLKNKQMIGTRYIEIIKSTKAEQFHIAHHRGFFTLVDGVQKFHGNNLVNTTDQYPSEGVFLGNLPRIRTSGNQRRDDQSLQQAFTGLGIAHRGQQFQQQQQQHYHPGALGTYAQGNYPGVMSQQPVMQMGISQHHTTGTWMAMPTNRAGPPTPGSAFSPTGAGALPQQHWDTRHQNTGSYTTTPPQPQQQSMLMTPFVMHPFLTAQPPPQTAPWTSPATATYMALPQQQQQQSAAANTWYGGTHMVIPITAAGGVGGGGTAMARHYPGFQGYTSDGRRYYPRQQQQQQQPRSNSQYHYQQQPQYMQQQQQQQQLRGSRGRSGSGSTSSGSQLTQSAPTATTSSSSKGTRVAPLPQQPEQTSQEVSLFGTEKIIFGQGIPSSSTDSAVSCANSSGDARSSSSPT
jgi:hypothetical protein